MEQKDVMEMLNCHLNDNLTFTNSVASNTFTTSGSTANLVNTVYIGDNLPADSCIGGWTFWRDYYYPNVIRESYPVYISERAKDKGKQAFELLKMLKDKRFINLEKVGDFVDLMDELIKIL